MEDEKVKVSLWKFDMASSKLGSRTALEKIPSISRTHLSSLNSADAVQGRLMNCEKLKPKESCETVYLSQLLPFVKRVGQTCNYEDVYHPTLEVERICRIIASPEDIGRDVRAANVFVAENLFSKGVSILDVVATLSEPRPKLVGAKKKAEDRDRRSIKGAMERLKGDKKKEVVGRSIARMEQRLNLAQTQVAFKFPSPQRLPPAQSAIVEFGSFVRTLISRFMVSQAPEARPTVGIEVIYGQDWCSKGYRRSRLIRSIPLAAEARKEIKVKSWEIRKDLRKENESVDKDISSEIVGDEKWSLATAKSLSGELNQTVNAGLKASGEVPIKGATVGGEANASSETSGTVKASITETEERVHQATIKSSNTLKQKFSSSVETSEEFGLETVDTDTIANPNKCHTLTYHFFEVSELFELTTRVESVAPVLLVPLPYPSVTPEWLLCHECLMRQHLPCDTLYAGFDGARQVLAGRKLGEFLGDVDTEEINAAADAALEAVENVLSIYYTLANSQIIIAPAGEGSTNQEFEDFVDGLEQFGDDAAGFFEDVGDGVAEVVESIVDAGNEAVNAAGEFIGEVFGNIFGQPQAQTAQGRTLAFSVVQQPGGPGSYIYWEIAKIAAPELENALAGLKSSYEHISTMQSGPRRTTALIAALNNFTTTLGDSKDVFGKIDLAITVVGGVVATVAAVGSIGAAIIAAAAAPATIPVALVFGVTVIGALHAFGGFIAAIVAENSGIDVIPDDEGLKAAIAGLTGMAQNLGHSIDLPPPPQSDDPAVTAAYQQELQEARQRRRELAQAQVDLDSLICHINDNISHYAQIYWEAVSSEDLERRLREEFHIPPHVLETKIVGFSAGRAAFRVRNFSWLRMSGLDLEAALRELRKDGVVEDNGKVGEVEMPTRGVTVEPELGSCDACDEFIRFHRDRDRELKTEEVAQAKIETNRAQTRLDNSVLGDPRPFDRADSISVSTTFSEEANDASDPVPPDPDPLPPVDD